MFPVTTNSDTLLTLYDLGKEKLNKFLHAVEKSNLDTLMLKQFTTGEVFFGKINDTGIKVYCRVVLSGDERYSLKGIDEMDIFEPIYMVKEKNWKYYSVQNYYALHETICVEDFLNEYEIVDSGKIVEAEIVFTTGTRFSNGIRCITYKDKYLVLDINNDRDIPLEWHFLKESIDFDRILNQIHEETERVKLAQKLSGINKLKGETMIDTEYYNIKVSFELGSAKGISATKKGLNIRWIHKDVNQFTSYTKDTDISIRLVLTEK